ncbi:MAG: hypothetical protein QOH72_679 [Solirubrobacteraceae bacterium]|nr:hypothetical protein [Solirubrobacteraceae bacterium]
MIAQQQTGPGALGRPAVKRGPLVALVLSVVALSVGGIAISVGLIEKGATQPTVPALKGPFGTSQDIPTSFGAVAIDNVEKVNGLTAKDLAGVTHGIANYVPPNKVQVQASVTLTNLLNEQPVAYSPTQFRLLAGKNRKPVKDVRASFRPGTLQPNASISGQVKFIAPRTGSQLWIEFTDPKRSEPLLIDLGRTGTTPDNAFDGFHKH